MTAAGFLDWHAHPVGPSLACRICAQPAMCRDHLGRPCHKTCAEAALTDQPAIDGGALVVALDAYRTARPARRIA